jgi:hypothetical protein
MWALNFLQPQHQKIRDRPFVDLHALAAPTTEQGPRRARQRQERSTQHISTTGAWRASRNRERTGQESSIQRRVCRKTEALHFDSDHVLEIRGVSGSYGFSCRPSAPGLRGDEQEIKTISRRLLWSSKMFWFGQGYSLRYTSAQRSQSSVLSASPSSVFFAVFFRALLFFAVILPVVVNIGRCGQNGVPAMRAHQ